MPDLKRTATGVLGGFAGLVGLSVVAGLLVTATVTPAIAVTSNAATSAITMFDNLPEVLDIQDLMLPTTIYAHDPAANKEVEMTSFYDQNRLPVTFDQISPVMYDAILSSEDPRYYQHGGIDLLGTTRALINNARGGVTQGGSSISQQYVKNVLIQKCESEAKTQDEALACWGKVTESNGSDGIQRKVQEMRYAIALEQRYSKNDILLGYLNIANFGGLTYGIEAASQYYFGVTSKKLSVAQAATLAGIVQNPNKYRIDQPGNTENGKADGYADTKVRQKYVLGRMLDDGKITKAQYKEAVDAPITPKITPPTTGCAATQGAAYFCQYVVSIIKNDPAFGATPADRLRTLKRGGLNIYTTLDFGVQVPAQNIMAQYTPTSVAGMNFGSTSVSIEAATGRILAIAQNTTFSEDADVVTGNPNYSSLVYAGDSTHGGSDGFNAGSTFKLFTLIDWLEKGHSVNEVLNGRVRVIPRMTNSCTGDWVNVANDKIGNFGGGGGSVSTPMYFTAQSLNSGYFAMAEKLDLCDIQKVATKMGVVLAKGGAPVDMSTQFSVIGSNAVSPIAMASAYATVANNGIYCQPRAIDKITDANGDDMPLPERTCKQVIDPKIAATAAYALQGVMAGGGTGSQGNPGDGTPLIGKTGTHEQWQTWLIESSTKVTTASWVGNTSGFTDVFKQWYNGIQLSSLRYILSREIQRAADSLYGGSAFPAPDSELTRTVLTDLPNVVGMSVPDATKALDDAGFQVIVGAPIDSTEGEGIIGQQDPGAGKVAGGAVVTIYPSTGKGIAVPDGLVGSDAKTAQDTLRSAGFDKIQAKCEAKDDAPEGPGIVTRVDPATGTVVNGDTRITLTIQRNTCDGQ